MQVMGQSCRQNRIAAIAYIDSIQNVGYIFVTHIFFMFPHYRRYIKKLSLIIN